MAIRKNFVYRIKNGNPDLRAMVLGDLNDHVSITTVTAFPYVGVIWNVNDADYNIQVSRWSESGKSMNMLDLNMGISEIEVGKTYNTINAMCHAVVVAKQEAQSDYPFVGYVKTPGNQLLTERWSVDGRAHRQYSTFSIDMFRDPI